MKRIEPTLMRALAQDCAKRVALVGQSMEIGCGVSLTGQTLAVRPISYLAWNAISGDSGIFGGIDLQRNFAMPAYKMRLPTANCPNAYYLVQADFDWQKMSCQLLGVNGSVSVVLRMQEQSDA